MFRWTAAFFDSGMMYISWLFLVMARLMQCGYDQLIQAFAEVQDKLLVNIQGRFHRMTPLIALIDISDGE